MGLLTQELQNIDAIDIVQKWLKKGCLEKRLQELADRIDAGEKIIMGSQLDDTGMLNGNEKFKLKQVYDMLKEYIEVAKDLMYNDDDDDDDDFDSSVEDSEDDDLNFDLDDDDDNDFKDLDLFAPTEDRWKELKEIFIKGYPTLDKMKSQINLIEGCIRKTNPDYRYTLKDGEKLELKYLLQIAKEAYAEATENSSEEKNDVSGADKTEENDNADNLEKKLEKIKKLFEKGLIDESDYKAKKNKLLGI